MVSEQNNQVPAKRGWVPQTMLTIGLLLGAFLLYQAFVYRGFVSSLAEWQFGRIESYFPLATLLILLAVFSLVVWMVVSSIAKRKKRNELPEHERVFRNGHRLANGLTVIATVLGLAAVTSLVLMFAWVPSTGTPVAVNAGSSFAPESGATTDLRGLVRHDRTARFRQHILLFHRTIYYAPVEPVRGAAPGEPVAYFVERDDAGAGPATVETNRGLLRANALPGEIARMYQDAGIELSPEVMVLQPGTAHARWPFLVLAGQFALQAIIFGAFAYYERRRLKRTIERMAAAQEPAPGTAAPVQAV